MIFVPSAHATPPCECPDSAIWVLPEVDATLPPNARVFISASGLDASSLALTTDGGAAVPFDVVRGDGMPEHQAWLVPQSPIAGASLSLSLQVSGATAPTTYAWSVGGEADTAAPTLASASVAAAHLDGACATHVAAAATLTGASADALLVHVHLVPDAGAVADVWVPASRPIFGRFTAADWQSCMSSFQDAKAGERWTAEVTLFDVAGQSSPSVAAGSFTFSSASAGGSGCAGAEAPGWLWSGLALGMLWLRRRTA